MFDARTFSTTIFLFYCFAIAFSVVVVCHHCQSFYCTFGFLHFCVRVVVVVVCTMCACHLFALCCPINWVKEQNMKKTVGDRQSTYNGNGIFHLISLGSHKARSRSRNGRARAHSLTATVEKSVINKPNPYLSLAVARINGENYAKYESSQRSLWTHSVLTSKWMIDSDADKVELKEYDPAECDRDRVIYNCRNLCGHRRHFSVGIFHLSSVLFYCFPLNCKNW